MKKIITILLTVAMLATMSVPVFAANTTGGSAEIGFAVDPTYIVTIPTTVSLEKNDAEGVIALGNLHETPLADILASPRARAIREGFLCRRAMEELCRRCGYARKRFHK
jgi:hypothetical protein